MALHDCLHYVSANLILWAAASLLSASACVLKATAPQVDIGRTSDVSLECRNPHPAHDISEVVAMRILRWEVNEWNSVAECRGGEADVRMESEDAVAVGSVSSAAGSYLRLTWPVATNTTIGHYRCDVVSFTVQESVTWQKSLPVFITNKRYASLQLLGLVVEENKRACLEQLSSDKQEIVQNVTATLENKVKAIGQMVSRVVEERVREALEQMTERLEAQRVAFEQQLTAVKRKQQLQSCADAEGLGPRPVVFLGNGMEVVCDTITDGGGWIVIQRRASGEGNFFRDWTDYKYGFGDLSGNFWFGLEKIHQLTNQIRFELRIDFKYKEVDYFASYSKFFLQGETDNYKIQLSGFQGNVVNDMLIHNGAAFSTKDRDNNSDIQDCAQQYKGGWWYSICHEVNLNGLWGSKTFGEGMNWKSVTTHYDSVTFTEMKIRPLV
ncbi:fibrinogen C domain-containing protein 1-A [Aplysia californica]|uniref:Fibrinogen C domain-containing protein 1-A n=1 Tax=Aplysia californica TaxID=6500 RepID=A0ABM0K870_APLCA|nr:fibrinogen C domain-containing protein 1-A [Aplysia californica]